MRKIILLILIGCSEERDLRPQKIDEFLIITDADTSDIKQFVLSNFSNEFYNFEFRSINETKYIKNQLNFVILLSDSSQYRRIFGNNQITIRRDIFTRGDFAIGVWGQNEEELKFNLYKYKDFIDSIISSRIYDLAYERAFHFGEDKEKTKMLREIFSIDLKIPVGWRMPDTLNLKSSFYMFKINPERFFLVFIPNYNYLVNYETTSDLTRKFLENDSLYHLKISRWYFDELCLDGKSKNTENLKSYIFRACSVRKDEKFYFYLINVLDTTDANIFLVEVESFLRKLKFLDLD